MNGYGAAVTEVRRHVDDLAADLDVWVERAVGEPDARARKYAADAMTAIDRALWQLQQVRAVLIAEIRQSDDETAARADALLERCHQEGETTDGD